MAKKYENLIKKYSRFRKIKKSGVSKDFTKIRKFDGVVALYHDQGLIPAKLLDFDRTVNVTMGLPVIRCSPDHGTAFWIAGKRRARVDSMLEAVKLATRLAGRSR